MIQICEKCKRVVYDPKRHHCPPEWQAVIIDPWDGAGSVDNPTRRCFGDYADDAAESLAEQIWGVDFEYPDSMEIWVRLSVDYPWVKFEIEVERKPHFKLRNVTLETQQIKLGIENEQ